MSLVPRAGAIRDTVGIIKMVADAGTEEVLGVAIAITQVTLDGVMQSPGGPEEDPRNGFTHGAWAMPFVDDAGSQAMDETIAGEFDMLLGRRTYEMFAAHWPNQGDDNPIAKAFDKATKYVVTRSLDHLDWETSLRQIRSAGLRMFSRSPVIRGHQVVGIEPPSTM